jgi:hypothetical protein
VVITFVKIGLTTNTFHVLAVLLDQFSRRFGQDQALLGQKIEIVLSGPTRLNQITMSQQAKMMAYRRLRLFQSPT